MSLPLSPRQLSRRSALADPHFVWDGLKLGDIMVLPDGRSFSVRMLASLSTNDLDFGLLCLLGDLELMLAPSATSNSVQVLLPVESLPQADTSAKLLCDGAAAFWAPHLPAIGGAMGEVLFRLLLLISLFAPLVIVDRGQDRVFFLRIGELDASSLHVQRMPTSLLDMTSVPRFAAVLEPAVTPAPVLSPPSPIRVPAIKQPASTPRR